MGPLTLSIEVYWDHVLARTDGFFVVLSDSPATAALVPETGALGAPINAIAIGHAATGNKNYSFFDGQTWFVFGAYTETSGTNHWEELTLNVDASGNWTAAITLGEPAQSGNGTLAVANFSFTLRWYWRSS